MTNEIQDYILSFARFVTTTPRNEFILYGLSFGIVCTAISTEAFYKRGWKGGKKTILFIAPICGLLSMSATVFLMM